MKNDIFFLRFRRREKESAGKQKELQQSFWLFVNLFYVAK